MAKLGAPTDLRVLSLGAGVQSTALYLMALDGLVGPLPDVAIFADTQVEPPWVYETLWRLAAHGGDRLPIHIASAGDLGEAQKRKITGRGGRFAAVPFWTLGPNGERGIGRRQCTRDYKIDVVTRHVRGLLGLRPRQRATRFHVEEWIGISLDEVSRAKPSRHPWVTTRWPLLLDRPMRRSQIEAWLRDRWPHPVGKSACVFCPFRRPEEYARWREEHPALFAEACRWDDLVRDASKTGMTHAQYISATRQPLRELPTLAELQYTPQLNLFENECEGMCGV